MKGLKTGLFLAAAASVSVSSAWAAEPVAASGAAKSTHAGEVADCMDRAKPPCWKPEYDKAMACINRAIELDPKNPTLYQERAGVNDRYGRTEDAIKDFDTMLLLDPESVVGYLSRANVKNERHDYRGAIADDNIAIGLCPKNALAYNNRGIDRYDSGDYRGAIEDLSHALKLGSKEDSWSYWWRGNARDKLGDHQGAIDDLTRAITLDPAYALPYGDRARVRASLGDKAGALSDLEKALSLGGDYPHLHRQMADLLSSMGKPKQAVFYYRKVCQYSDDIGAICAMGIQNTLSENFSGAISDFVRAMRSSLERSVQKVSDIFRLLTAGRFGEANLCFGSGVKEFSDDSVDRKCELIDLKMEVRDTRFDALLTASSCKPKDHLE